MGKKTKTLSKSTEFRKYTLYVLIGGLITSALISMVAILIGDFGETIQRALFTTVLMMFHALLALTFIAVQPGRDKLVSSLITNVLFAIVVASFFTSVLGVWEVIRGDTVKEFYTSYGVAFIFTLVIGLLVGLRKEEFKTRTLAISSAGTLVFLYGLVQPWIFVDSNSDLPSLYFRSIGATSVLFVTLVVLATIFYKMHAAKHPATRKNKEHKQLSGWTIAVILIIFLLFGLPMLENLINSITSSY